MKQVFVVMLCLFYGHLFGQPNLNFRHLNTDDGLSQSWITNISQDHSGLIWICTEEGLNKFDGYSFELINNSEGLATGKVNCIHEIDSSLLLIGTSRGIYAYNQFLNSLKLRSDLPLKDIYAIASDSHGIWIGSNNLYFYNYETKTVKEYAPNRDIETSISSGQVSALHLDQKKRLWIGTNRGLNLYNRINDSFISFYHTSSSSSNSLSSNEVTSITSDHLNRLWVGTKDGLNLIQPNPFGENKFKQFKNNQEGSTSISKGSILALHCDRQNMLWIGIENGGLNLLDLHSNFEINSNFYHYTYDIKNPTGLSNNSIYTIFQDRQDNIWLGTFAGGINVYNSNSKKFSTYKKAYNDTNSLINNQVNVFLQDNNQIWIGTEGGLSVYDLKSQLFKHYLHDPLKGNSLGSNAIWALYQDHQGFIWVGTWGGGLNRYNPKTDDFTRYQFNSKDSSSLSSNNVFSIFEDKLHVLWIGTMGGGLNQMNEKKGSFSHFDIANSNLATNFVEQVYETMEGELLIANVKGIYEFNRTDGKFNLISLVDSNNNLENLLNVFAIHQDSSKRLWLGTELGLFMRPTDHSSFVHFNTTQGLPNNSVKSIVSDRQGGLWLGTNRGLFNVNVNLQSNQIIAVHNYTVEDGLQGNEFNRRAAMLSNKGLVYMGGVNGYNAFNPTEIAINPTPPNVLLTDFFVFNKSVEIGPKSILKEHISLTKEITLGHNISVFGFSFVGINYISTEKNQYAYLLEGFDQSWNFIGTKREVTYTNLNPGKYIFKVKASNNDGVWTEKPAEVTIVILPPFWKTNTAYGMYVILGIVSLYLFRKYSIIDIERKRDLVIEVLNSEKEAEINKSKMAFFTTISHEIRTPLTLIYGPINQVIQSEDITDKNKEQLELVNRNVNRLWILINQFLDFRKIDTGHVKMRVSNYDFDKIIDSIGKAFKQQAEIQKIDFVIEMSDPNLTGWVDEEKLTTILYNLISNAFKYVTDVKEVKVTMNKILLESIADIEVKKTLYESNRDGKDIVEIKVIDTGIGIEKEDINLIFDRFHQVENHTNKAGSSGIGLNIVKEYVKLHGGVITVESTIGQGSCFTIYIPDNPKQYSSDELIKQSNKS